MRQTVANRPLEIALVDPSGYSRPYDHELARALAARGHRVTLWTSPFAHGSAPVAEGYRVRELFYRRTNRIPGPAAARRAAKAIAHPVGLAAMAAQLRARPPDVVHVQWSVMRPLERSYYRLLGRAGIPVVFTAHDPRPLTGGARRRRSAAATARAFPLVIVHSDWGRRVLVESCGVAAERVRVVPHGVLAHLRELPELPPPVDPAGPMVLLPGLIRPYKGADVLLAAWPEIRARVPLASLVIAGRPMMDLGSLATDQPGVSVLPRFVSDAELAALLRRADVVALPYRVIDSSGIVFAALALDAAVVLSDVGGFRELHDSYGVGELVPVGDAGALAEVVAGVVSDPARRDRLREASGAAGRGPFDWSVVAAQTEDAYLSVAGRAQEPQYNHAR